MDYDDLSNASVCVDCGATGGEIELVQQSQFDSSGALEGCRRVAPTVALIDAALERRVRIFVDTAFNVGRKIGDNSITLRTELTTLARQTLPRYNRPPRGKQIHYAGAAAALLRARRMGCPVSLGDVARAATVPISKLSTAYNLLTKATGTVPPKPCDSVGYLSRYQDVAENLLPDVSDAWRQVRVTACVALRVVEHLWMCQGRNPALHCAVAVAFAVRAVACEGLAAVVPKVSNCAIALVEAGGVSKAAIMDEYKRIATAMAEVLGEKDEVHTRFDEAIRKLESNNTRMYSVTRKRKRCTSARPLAEEGESDDSEVERAVFSNDQATKRARIMATLET